MFGHMTAEKLSGLSVVSLLTGDAEENYHTVVSHTYLISFEKGPVCVK